MDGCDVLVVGGGIAGVSAAYFLTRAGLEVMVVEAEPVLARHSTGRSAALLFENYGPLPHRPLTRWSRRFLEEGMEGLVDHPVLTPRGGLTIATHDRRSELEAEAETGQRSGTDVRLIDPTDAAALVPVLRADLLAGAVWEPGSSDLDVAAIHQGFVRGIRRAGGRVRTNSPVSALTRSDRGWVARVGNDDVEARVVVDAAGAWADEVAGLARVPEVGIRPLRRTVFTVPGPGDHGTWPMVVEVRHDFYFKPEGPDLLCSPADQTPLPPSDPRPDELEIARAIEDINRLTTLGIRTVRASWAGLRCFAPDDVMVIGPEPEAEGFFWLAGQGGTGIQTAPAAGFLTASLVVEGSAPRDLPDVDVEALSPARFRTHRLPGS
ncbi:MAG: FAD-dependent catabolic D-arginine dehydrogenase DauA [Acidimicrobiia bacterium]|nr:MAG: FAD-dependent catabolic D-arginine dehydrogenase DauA [Acidimicrobiia bacterium]